MKFIVCYEDAAVAKDTLKEAQKHAVKWNAFIEIIQAVKREEPIKRSKLVEMEENLEETMAELFDGLEIPYNVQLQIDDIDVGEKIVELANRKKADLIFIGIKKRSKVGKLLFGSTAQYVILNALCPVVCVAKPKK
jgi:nucleotide-binding universal stress UspA family protein